VQNKIDILNTRFGYGSFRPGQEKAIDAILAGSDVLAVMPTGAGKSLCYQIPAMLLPGVTVVISPLISLMKDQVASLRAAGCPAAFLNSSLTASEYSRTVAEIRGGRVKLLYVAPERLYRELPMPEEHDAPPLVVVDEAHCVSQWGHDFRTSYLEIADFIAGIKPRPVTGAFTATATARVKEDIGRILRLRDPVAVHTGFDRPNLYFEVRNPGRKPEGLLECLEGRRGKSGIVYCATRKAVDEVHGLLLGKGFEATRYHAGLNDGERRRNQDDFLHDRSPVMVATNAFGMGIDKADVSFVVHYNMPKNIESYYQEAGRAGRNGERADCILLYSGSDVHLNDFIISNSDDEGGADPRLLAHNRELLRQITFYATGSDCLRHRLLSYFGEAVPAAGCGNCGNCLTEYEQTDVTLEARKIISCVYRLRQRGLAFGKTTIADVLRGSRTDKIKRFDLDSLSVWGIMDGENPRHIRAVIEFLVEGGFLATEGDEFPVLAIGAGCNDVVTEQRRLYMKMPKDAGRPAKPPRSRGLPSDGEGGEGGEVDDALYEKLRNLRRAVAAREAIPPYLVFSDASLRDMCRKKPCSLAQFTAVRGVGPAKLEKYGRIFVAAIGEG